MLIVSFVSSRLLVPRFAHPYRGRGRPRHGCTSPLQRAHRNEADEGLDEVALGADDILDVRGDQAVLGKSIGKDAEEHKLTYVTRFGLERAEEMAERTADRESAVL